MYTFRLIHNFKSCNAFNTHIIVRHLQRLGITIFDGDSVRTSSNLKNYDESTGKYDGCIVNAQDMPVLYCKETQKYLPAQDFYHDMLDYIIKQWADGTTEGGKDQLINYIDKKFE